MSNTLLQYERLGVHCQQRDRVVIRAARGMLSKEGKSHLLRDARHVWLRAILREHRDARSLYRQVMGGTL